jgi:hypothetical protein
MPLYPSVAGEIFAAPDGTVIFLGIGCARIEHDEH